MYLLEYHRNPRMFWATLAALIVAVVMLWPRAPHCSNPVTAWDNDAGNVVTICPR